MINSINGNFQIEGCQSLWIYLLFSYPVSRRASKRSATGKY